MPQLQLPIFPEGVTHITDLLAFKKEGGQVVYLNGHIPIFFHDERDLHSFLRSPVSSTAADTANKATLPGPSG
jgi:hypothetical protein